MTSKSSSEPATEPMERVLYEEHDNERRTDTNVPSSRYGTLGPVKEWVYPKAVAT